MFTATKVHTKPDSETGDGLPEYITLKKVDLPREPRIRPEKLTELLKTAGTFLILLLIALILFGTPHARWDESLPEAKDGASLSAENLAVTRYLGPSGFRWFGRNELSEGLPRVLWVPFGYESKAESGKAPEVNDVAAALPPSVDEDSEQPEALDTSTGWSAPKTEGKSGSSTAATSRPDPATSVRVTALRPVNLVVSDDASKDAAPNQWSPNPPPPPDRPIRRPSKVPAGCGSKIQPMSNGPT